MKVPPLGILYVGNALKQAGYEVEIQHFPPSEIHQRVEQIARKKPLFVGISAFTSNQTRFSAEFSRDFRSRCDSPVVWGGVHSSMVPEQTLSESYVDMIVVGEGEETVVDLANVLTNGRDLNDVQSIGFKVDGEPILTEPRPLIKDLDQYKLDWELIDIEKYLTPMWGYKRVISFITSRGCPYRCGFCYNMRFNRGRWRGQSKEFVIREIKELQQRYGIEGIRFYDDNFFASKRRATEILKAIDMPWEGQLRIGYITDEVAQTLRDTHCQGICFGMESGNNRILKLIHKDQTTDDIIRGTRVMARYPEVRANGCFILGNPTETRQEIQNTINFCLMLSKIHPRISFSLGAFLPFPGVPLYDLLIEEGFVPPKTTEDWEIINRANDEMEMAWLPWVDDKERQDLGYAGRYSLLIQLSYLRLPVLNKIVYWRLKNYNFRFPIELAPLEWVVRVYGDESSHFGLTLRKVATRFRSRRGKSKY